MSNSIFTLILGLVLHPLLFLAYTVLPREQWQIIAAIPTRKAERDGWWHGTNITYYGALLASGSLFGVIVFFLLLAALGVPMWGIIGLILAVMGCSVAAAKLLAMAVEKKQNTFTVGGAAIIGLISMPPAVAAYNGLAWRLDSPQVSLIPVMGALAVAYLLGEGIGRLACLSFGCCYGKPLSKLGPKTRRIFAPFAATFHGSTKKIAYASGLAGVGVVPIQAITSFFSVSIGLVSMYLFLEGYFSASFLLASLFALAWRILSEYFRADYRGEGKFSAYQQMALWGMGYCTLLALYGNSGAGNRTNLAAGLASLWNPAALLFFQALWLLLFIYTGISSVTGSTVAFHVRGEKI
ncbi:MAG: prolipoprotein diacylglyceryl transferase [Desulfobulbaceae bacterium]|nr:prolipoprotein diacylglyceryl transferase [Desulfobulbaceae bacterium]HIJ89887.1 prolipoprotein diacylglyceryl transferase [Deltaproteobacteria bacterium]